MRDRIFGWSLPPGCGTLPGEDDYCEVCEREAGDCICPECPVCGVAGDPDCYVNGHMAKTDRSEDIRELYQQVGAAMDAERKRVRTNPMSPDDLFTYAPEGDFKWDDCEAGDWHIYCCGDKDCPVGWHKVAYSTVMGRKDGKRFVEIHSVDEDGNWDFDYGWEDGEDFFEIAVTIAMQSAEYFYGWAQYWLECAEQNCDILGDVPAIGVDRYLDNARDMLKYLKA